MLEDVIKRRICNNNNCKFMTKNNKRKNREFKKISIKLAPFMDLELVIV